MVGGLSIYGFLNFISSSDATGLQQFLQNNHVEVTPYSGLPFYMSNTENIFPLLHLSTEALSLSVRI